MKMLNDDIMFSSIAGFRSPSSWPITKLVTVLPLNYYRYDEI